MWDYYPPRLMIISRTPVRVSFCGGGTDVDSFASSEPNGGMVTSLALNRHIHVTVNRRFDDKVRVSYSSMETVDDFEDLNHELVREAMRLTGVTSGVEITTIADIPSRGTGLGSSSAVTVGLLNALHRFAGREVSAEQLAEEACQIEIDVLGQPIGRQDQYAAAFGGVNSIRFGADGVEIEPLGSGPWVPRLSEVAGVAQGERTVPRAHQPLRARCRLAPVQRTAASAIDVPAPAETRILIRRATDAGLCRGSETHVRSL